VQQQYWRLEEKNHEGNIGYKREREPSGGEGERATNVNRRELNNYDYKSSEYNNKRTHYKNHNKITRNFLSLRAHTSFHNGTELKKKSAY